MKAEEGYAEHCHLLACTHLQEITVPVWKGHGPGLDAWAGQVSKEWDTPVTDPRWRENLRQTTSYKRQKTQITGHKGLGMSKSCVCVCKDEDQHQGSFSVPLEIQGQENPDPAPRWRGQDLSQSLKVSSSHPLHYPASPVFAGDSRALASHHVCVSLDPFEAQFPNQNQLGFKLS